MSGKQSNLQYIDAFADMLMAERGASPNTVQSYRTDLELYCEQEPKQSLLAATTEGLQGYLKALSKNGYSERSIARKISVFRNFFTFLLSEGIIEANPALHLERPKSGHYVPKAMSCNEIDTLLTAAAKDTTPEGLRLNAMMELLYSSGMRISEMLSIKLTQMRNIEREPYITIQGKGRKERMILINPPAVKALASYLAVYNHFTKGATSEWLFPSHDQKGKLAHLTRQRFGQLLKGLALAAGLLPECVAPHRIRHSFASHMLQNGADLRIVQELLGHADISSTQIYTKVLAKQVQEFVLQHHPLAEGEK